MSVIQLVDETDDEGPIWDTKPKVVPIQWWHGPQNGTLVNHTGSLGWMNFIGRWGNLGDNGWLNKLAGISYVVDGPTGPNRDFRGNINVRRLPLMMWTELIIVCGRRSITKSNEFNIFLPPKTRNGALRSVEWRDEYKSGADV